MILRQMNTKREGALIGLLAWLGAGLPVLLLCAGVSGMFGQDWGFTLPSPRIYPKIPDLKSYRPKTVSTFYAGDSTVIGLFLQGETVSRPLESIPPHVINAFLAAEDSRFFSHAGVDGLRGHQGPDQEHKGRNLRSGRKHHNSTSDAEFHFVQTKDNLPEDSGGYVSSFQTERSIERRKKSLIYLNEIYLGKGSYGLEAAARTHFGKPATKSYFTEASACWRVGF